MLEIAQMSLVSQSRLARSMFSQAAKDLLGFDRKLLKKSPKGYTVSQERASKNYLSSLNWFLMPASSQHNPALSLEKCCEFINRRLEFEGLISDVTEGITPDAVRCLVRDYARNGSIEAAESIHQISRVSSVPLSESALVNVHRETGSGAKQNANRAVIYSDYFEYDQVAV